MSNYLHTKLMQRIRLFSAPCTRYGKPPGRIRACLVFNKVRELCFFCPGHGQVQKTWLLPLISYWTLPGASHCGLSEPQQKTLAIPSKRVEGAGERKINVPWVIGVFLWDHEKTDHFYTGVGSRDLQLWAKKICCRNFGLSSEKDWAPDLNNNNNNNIIVIIIV